MKKHIALFVPHNGNVGDTIHTAGAEYLLEKVFPKTEYKYHKFIQHDKPYENYNFFKCNYSYIIIVGAPYLFKQFYNSYKYGNEIRDLLKRNKQAKIIALGIGSCFPMNYKVTEVYKDKKYKKELKDFYKHFGLIIVRDKLSYQIFNKAKIKARLLPCPSMFVFKKYKNIKLKKKRKKPLVMFGNPNSISYELLTDKQKLHIERVQKTIGKKLNYRYNPCAIQYNDAWMVINWKNFKSGTVKKIRNRLDLFNQLKKASYVISTRVHTAIPASLLGLDTYLIPFDTRTECVDFFNIKVIDYYKDIKPYKHKDINKDKFEQKYLSLLKEMLPK